MRMRPLFASLLLAGGTVALLAGCSGKPENSPVIRQKFAEVEEMSQTVERLTADVQMLNEQVVRLTQENSELRAFLPDVDGESAVNKLSSLEARMKKIEGMAGSGVLSASAPAAASGSGSSQANASSTSSRRPVDLTEQGLATDRPASSDSGAGEAALVAMQAEQSSAQAARPVRSFREMTNPEAPKPESKPAATQSKPAENKPKPAAQPAPARRGAYHTIAAGETVDSIAKKHGVTTEAILKANRLPKGVKLGTGQRIYVPGS